MRRPLTTSAFRRDWRRLAKSGRLADSEPAFRRVVAKLLADEPLPRTTTITGSEDSGQANASAMSGRTCS